MNEHDNRREGTGLPWHVMEHLSPQWIEVMLQRESSGKLVKWQERDKAPMPEPFEFFVPYLFMRSDSSDELRSDFHSFVFIRASAERLSSILGADWNTFTRLRLTPYRDKSGRAITISDEEFQQLKSLFMDRQLKAFFGLPVESISSMIVGDEVTLLLEGWQGKKGRIESISLKKGQVSMVVAVNILGSTRSINFHDLHDGDVIFADHDTEQLLTGNLISNLENGVVTILGHSCQKKSAERLRKDIPLLRRILSYAHIQIEDEDERKRFNSLMLICASLLEENEATSRYKTQLQQWLCEDSSIAENPSFRHFPYDVNEPASLSDAYMMLALFVSTRDPRLRDAVKAYYKNHQDCPPILGTFINKIRDVQTVKPV